MENLTLLKTCMMADGSLNFSSLEVEAQKRMHSFVKDQRRCYRQRENDEPSPMTDERFRLLSEAKFDFKPSETKGEWRFLILMKVGPLSLANANLQYIKTCI